MAEGVALAIGHVATRRGNRLGVLAFGDGEPRVLSARARAGSACSGCWPSCAASPPATAPARPRSAPRSRGAAALGRQRGLVVIVSDFRGDARLGGPAARAARPPRRDGGRDPRPARAGARADGRPLAGGPRDRPPGPRRHRTRRKVRERFAAAAAAEREEVARRAAPRRAPTTSCSPPRATGCAIFARHLRRGEAALRAGAPARAAVIARLTAEGTPAETQRHAAPLGRARAGAGAGRMSFAEPILLAGFVLRAAGGAGLRLAAAAQAPRGRRLGRTRRSLPNLVTARPGWRRHVPPALLLLALAALVVALARPQRTVAAPAARGQR